jgi:RNA polymerase sigma factor (sigma-70 family)
MSAIHPTMTDAELAAAVSDPVHGRDALRLLYERHAVDLLALLRSRASGLAGDISQEAWIRVTIELRKGPRDMPNFRGWLWTMAQNLLRSEWRKRRPDSDEIALETAPSEEHSPMLRLEHLERETVLRRCFEALHQKKPEFAEVVRAVLDGESPTEASNRLGITRANFDQRKKRAISALQHCVESRVK